jgi:superfamily II DNA or RNA helicase
MVEELLEKALDGVTGERRAYQQRISEKVLRHWTGTYKTATGKTLKPAKSVLVTSPTGSGKTFTGLMTAAALQQHHPDLLVVWTAMRRNLLTQAERELKERGFKLRVHFASIFEKEFPAEFVKRKKTPLLIVPDEAQHDAATSSIEQHEILKPDYALGLTATPFRSDRLHLCFEKVVADVGIQQLIQLGYLSPYDLYTIPSWCPAEVAEHYLRDRERWGKSLVYFHQEHQCREFAAILGRAGVRCPIVTAKTDRESQIEEFRDGAVDVMVNMAVLTEGFDCPELKTAFVRDSVKGPTIQMAGRVFRKHKDVPVKQVVQSCQTHHSMLKTASPVTQYRWQDVVWRSVKPNPELRAFVLSQSLKIAKAKVALELPSYYEKKFGKRRRRGTPELKRDVESDGSGNRLGQLSIDGAIRRLGGSEFAEL